MLYGGVENWFGEHAADHGDSHLLVKCVHVLQPRARSPSPHSFLTHTYYFLAIATNLTYTYYFLGLEVNLTYI